MSTQETWIKKAKECLQNSLHPVPHETNELDWKLTITSESGKVAEHLSAFANQKGGGFLVLGIDPAGQVQGIGVGEVESILKKLGNTARDGLDPPQVIRHFTDTFAGKNVLFVHVPEAAQKPVHLRGKGIEFSYIRSGSQTRKMGQQEIANAVLTSKQLRYEELGALTCDEADILKFLDHEEFFRLLEISVGQTPEFAIEQMINQKLVYRSNGNFLITNLGVIVAARDLTQFQGKERFPVRVIKYRGNSRLEPETEKEFSRGYGVGFQELIRYIVTQLPKSEIIRDALRRNAPIYPEITIRELVANALIHRDFTVTGTNPMVEIFLDRIEIMNPGGLLPSIQVDRLIDSAPESRNEIFASLMRRMGICEERGSGIDRALFEVEVYGLPPVEFRNEPSYFKAILYSPKSLKQMTTTERLLACYQHCCLRWVSGEPMTNASFRKRLGLKDNQYAQAWRIIDAAAEKGIIKPRDAKNRSRKYASYIPAWV